MELERGKQQLRRWLERLGGYKYVLLVIAAGAVLLLWPEAPPQSASEAGEPAPSFSVEELEAELEQILSRVEGAGEVTVMLTVEAGTQRVLAQDTVFSDQEESSQTVVISTGSGSEEAVVVKEYYPTFQGALVVCPGGGDAQVKLLLTQAVSALTGLGAARISVCQGT